MKFTKPILVGTQHKAGTVFMKNVFDAAAKDHGLTLLADDGEGLAPKPGVDIYFSDKTRFRNEFLSLEGGFYGFRLIRDPRDMMISGAHYHIKATESWLDDPIRPELAFSYRALLAAQPTLRSRYLVEMVHLTKNTCDVMADFYQYPHCMRQDQLETLKLEQVSLKGGYRPITSLMEQWALPEPFIRSVQKHMEKLQFDQLGAASKQHVTSQKTGARWPDELDQAIGMLLLNYMRPALLALGYETGDDWLQQLPVYRKALDEILS